MTSEAKGKESIEHVAETDWFLQSLVTIVNESNFEIGVTLQVSGMLVSGNLVCLKSYFAGFAEEFSTAFSDPDAAATIKQAFASHGDASMPPLEDGAERPVPQFIHLKNARFFNTSGDPIPGNRGVWWRGRASEVGGFMLGTLASEPAKSISD